MTVRLHSWKSLLEIVMVLFPTAAALTLFMATVMLLVVAFLGYQLMHIAQVRFIHLVHIAQMQFYRGLICVWWRPPMLLRFVVEDTTRQYQGSFAAIISCMCVQL